MGKFDCSLQDIMNAMNAFANTNSQQKKRKKVQYASNEDRDIALMKKQLYGFDGRFDSSDWDHYLSTMKKGFGVDLQTDLPIENIPIYEKDDETLKQVYVHVILGTNLSKHKQMGISFRFVGQQTNCPYFSNFGEVIKNCIIGRYWPLDKETGKPTTDADKAEWAIAIKAGLPETKQGAKDSAIDAE